MNAHLPAKRQRVILLMVLAAVAALMAAGPVLAQEQAEEAGPSWRPTYDLVMRWVNFVILAGLIYKYLRRPLMIFLRGEKDKIKTEIQALEAAKAQADDNLRQIEDQLAGKAQRLEQSRTQSAAAAEKRRDQIIEQARDQSRLILEAGQRAVEGQIQQAKARLREEMVDAAMAIVARRLPQEITDADRQAAVTRYLEGI